MDFPGPKRDRNRRKAKAQVKTLWVVVMNLEPCCGPPLTQDKKEKKEWTRDTDRSTDPRDSPFKSYFPGEVNWVPHTWYIISTAKLRKQALSIYLKMMIIHRLSVILQEDVCVEHLGSRRALGLCSPYKTNRKSTGTVQTSGKLILIYWAIKELTSQSWRSTTLGGNE